MEKLGLKRNSHHCLTDKAVVPQDKGDKRSIASIEY